MHSLITRLTLLVYILAGLLLATCDGQVTLAWNPSSGPSVLGYNLCWGTSSGDYTFTNNCTSAQTSGTVSNLAGNTIYYFAVQSFMSNGLVSPFSTEVTFTNESSSTNPASIFVASTNGPPPPGQSTNGGSMSPVVSGNGGSSSSSGSGGGGTVTNVSGNFWGVPPFVAMTVSLGHPSMDIGGTVGATLMIQATTNLFSADSWETITNITLTNVALLAESNQGSQTQDALDVAFLPAAQAFPIAPSNSAPFQIFRVVMPYDYAILGSIVLKGQGYNPRLIVVNMPGIISDDACYVNEGSSFIHYDATNSTLQLEGSGPSIRQIATTLANSLNLNWTSASEFTYSNGLCQILATVVETEPAASDPVLGKKMPGKPTVIDF
jgi:hypothetical protein